jgi:predicted  nucleic acid-binding Zn-ribbon protein
MKDVGMTIRPSNGDEENINKLVAEIQKLRDQNMSLQGTLNELRKYISDKVDEIFDTPKEVQPMPDYRIPPSRR